PMAPSEWSPPGLRSSAPERHTDVSAIARSYTRGPASAPPSELVERAAGTGLTGRSNQRFEPSFVGTLEHETTVLQLRLVIGTDEAFSAAHPLHQTDNTPARPAARP